MKFKTILAVAIILLSASVSQAQLNVNFLGRLAYNMQPGQRLSNISGFADAVGNEYALVGAPGGLSIVDVTNPATPVQLFLVPTQGATGNQNNWREIKTIGNYAYVTTEAGGGLQVVDLSNLPASVNHINWTGDGTIAGNLGRIHALHVDNDYAYLYGPSGLANGGIIIVNVSNPMAPTYAGMYDLHYVHDGYVRNDTVYACEIYQGQVAIIGVTNKAAPSLVTTVATPTAFPHNSWLSDDSKTMFTTDENSPNGLGSYLASFDVSDKTNISELDRIQATPGSGSVVHNTHVINDYCVTSWYHDGITIVDAARPANLIQVGNYDVSPLTGNGYNGVWGVYPWLPSGNLLVTDRDSGLYILGATYVRGCYLEGIVTDSVTGMPISGAFVEIISTPVTELSKITGDYKTGLPTAGTYNVVFSKAGYYDKTFTGVTLSNGMLTILNAPLASISTGIAQADLTNEFVIHPNPASTQINIQYAGSANTDFSVSITNMVGQQVAAASNRSALTSTMVDVSSLTPGLYLLHIATAKGIAIKKIVKQ